MMSKHLFSIIAVIAALAIVAAIVWVKRSGQSPQTASTELETPQVAVEGQSSQSSVLSQAVESAPSPTPWLPATPLPTLEIDSASDQRTADYWAEVAQQIETIKTTMIPRLRQLYARDAGMVEAWTNDPKLFFHQTFAEYKTRRQSFQLPPEGNLAAIEPQMDQIQKSIEEIAISFDYQNTEPQPFPEILYAPLKESIETVEKLVNENREQP